MSSGNKQKIAVFTFGRFNPITKGHEKLFRKVKAVADKKGGDPLIFPSWTFGVRGKKNNPLTFKLKVGFIKRLIPWVESNIIQDENIKTAWDIPEYLSKLGYTKVYFIAGSDRIGEYKTRWLRHAREYLKADVISAGMRNPAAKGIEGMSASKAQQAATKHDLLLFQQTTGWKGEIAKELMEVVAQNL